MIAVPTQEVVPVTACVESLTVNEPEPEQFTVEASASLPPLKQTPRRPSTRTRRTTPNRQNPNKDLLVTILILAFIESTPNQDLQGEINALGRQWKRCLELGHNWL